MNDKKTCTHETWDTPSNHTIIMDANNDVDGLIATLDHARGENPVERIATFYGVARNLAESEFDRDELVTWLAAALLRLVDARVDAEVDRGDR